MGNLFFNQDIKENPLKQKAATNKSNGNARWWRTNKRKDPNAMDVLKLVLKHLVVILLFLLILLITWHRVDIIT
jgi:hypothetical protein